MRVILARIDGLGQTIRRVGQNDAIGFGHVSNPWRCLHNLKAL
jgi:hypothetical protein